jgi:hypothetical protein
MPGLAFAAGAIGLAFVGIAARAWLASPRWWVLWTVTCATGLLLGSSYLALRKLRMRRGMALSGLAVALAILAGQALLGPWGNEVGAIALRTPLAAPAIIEQSRHTDGPHICFDECPWADESGYFGLVPDARAFMPAFVERQQHLMEKRGWRSEDARVFNENARRFEPCSSTCTLSFTQGHFRFRMDVGAALANGHNAGPEVVAPSDGIPFRAYLES